MSQWNALVRLCAYISATVAVARGAAVGDRESIGIGVALVVAEIATHLPWKPVVRLGWLGLTALFVNQGFWMITAVVSLTSAAPSIAGAAAPAVLSVPSRWWAAFLSPGRTRPSRTPTTCGLSLAT
jgi:hypothetical protein